MLVLSKPRQAGPYPDGDIGCQEALDEAVLELPKGLKSDDIVKAAGGDLARLDERIAPLVGGEGLIDRTFVGRRRLTYNQRDVRRRSF